MFWKGEFSGLVGVVFVAGTARWLEQKTDIPYIQVLMGHEGSMTRECYLHITSKGFSAMKSLVARLDINFWIPDDKDE